MINYSENVLANQNYVAKPNSVWVADITSFELDENKKVYDVFQNPSDPYSFYWQSI
jgi:hypothetical protein